MPVTITEDSSGVAAQSDEPSEMIYGVGQSAWLAVVTVVAFVGLALGLVAVIVAGSDDSGGGGGTASDGAAPSGPVSEADVGASEFAFDPSDIELVADTEATITLTNNGAVEHNWTVLEQDVTVTTEEEVADAPVAGLVETVPAGETGTGTLTLAEGTYQVICTIPGHFAAGMEGVVTASAPAA